MLIFVFLPTIYLIIININENNNYLNNEIRDNKVALKAALIPKHAKETPLRRFTPLRWWINITNLSLMIVSGAEIVFSAIVIASSYRLLLLLFEHIIL